ncbi:hypothetical protein TcCL_ESM11177 [Trypanosoma cruzi]|nr:hypothetical protein TcCL_ESM11177 [Trypanosoma cruzi]
MRLFHIRVTLGTPMKEVHNGVGVVGAQALSLSHDKPWLDPQLPIRPHTMDGSIWFSKFGTRDAQRFPKCPATVISSQCLAIVPEINRKPVMVAPTVRTASDGPWP